MSRRTSEPKGLETPSPLQYDTENAMRNTLKRAPSLKMGSPPKPVDKQAESPGMCCLLFVIVVDVVFLLSHREVEMMMMIDDDVLRSCSHA